MSKTLVNIRIEKSLKEKAEKLSKELGLSLTASITLFLKAMVREKGLPFSVTTISKADKKQVQKPDYDDFDFDDIGAIGETSIKDAIDKL